MKHKIDLKQTLFFVSLLCFFTLKAFPSHFKDSLSLDSSIRSGQFDNGFSYFIKQLPDASGKVHMSLVVKVGHNHQQTGEYEFAHIVEHLGFSSGKNVSFSKSFKLFDEIGLNLGETGGQTSNEYTNFNLKVSGTNNKGLDVGLRFFEDIIWNLDLTENNINKERISVYNELNQTAITFPFVLRTLKRKMIGYEVKFSTKDKNDHLNSFRYEDLQEFYNKWYFPANMALVLTGNIQNIDVLEEEIKRRFAKPAQIVESPYHENKAQEYRSKEPQFLKKPFPQPIEKPEFMRAMLNFFIRDKGEECKNSVANIKTGLTKKLLVSIMNRRLREMRETYNVNFSARMELAEAPFALKTHISFLGKYDEDVLKEIIRGFVDVEQNGFSINEFNQSKESLIQSINNQDTLSSSIWRSKITSHFVSGEPLPVNKNKLETTLLRNLTLDNFNNIVKDYLRGHPDDIILTAHPGHPLLSYSESEIRNWFSQFNKTVIEPYTAPEIPKVLIDSIALSQLELAPYTGGNTRIPFAKAFELQNGIKIVLKSTTTTSPARTKKNNKIHFRGYGQTGIFNFPKEDFFSAMNAAGIVMNSGVGGLDKFELKRFLTANDFQGNVRPYIGYKEAGIEGSASMEDLETALQLVYLYFTAPNFGKVAFQDWKKNESYSLTIIQDINNENLLNVIRDSLMYQEFLPKGTKAVKGLKQTDFTQVKEIYRQLFKNSGDLTFLFSGAFEEQEVLALCRKYLGNLPLNQNSKIYPNQQTPPEQRNTGSPIILKSTWPMELAKVRLLYIPKEDILNFDWKEEIKIEILRRSLSELLLRELRFESSKGGIYSAGAGRYNSKTYNHHKIFIKFDCKPQDTERMITEAKELVDILKDKGPENKLIEKIKKNMISDTNNPENDREILQKMYDFEKRGDKWVNRMNKHAFLESLTPHDIFLTAKKYLNTEPYEFIMLP